MPTIGPASIISKQLFDKFRNHARAIMRAYRDFLPRAPEELGAFLGLKMVPATAPFPKEFWGARICLRVSCYNGSEDDGKKALAPLLDTLPPPALNWMDDALSGHAEPLRPTLSDRHAVVLERRLREIAPR